jgi:uncharacterized protein (TIGR03086 family)
MELHPVMEKAAQAVVEVAGNVKPDQLTAPTPCQDWDVRTLVNHLILWSGFRSELAARKAAAPPDGPMDESMDFTQGGDWAELLASQVGKTVTAWAQPQAWEGNTGLAGGSLPASTIAAMIFGEYVLHGWDLARATGQDLPCDDEVAKAALTYVEGMAEQARQYHVFGDPVPVPDNATTLDKALALSGRDPGWSAGRPPPAAT